MGDIETIKEFRTRRASSKKISRNVCLSNGDTGGTNVYTRRVAGFERSTIDFEKNDEFYRDLLLLEFFLFRKRCFENCYYQMDETTISFPRSNPSMEIQFIERRESMTRNLNKQEGDVFLFVWKFDRYYRGRSETIILFHRSYSAK